MSTKFPHLKALITGHPWAIMEDRLEAIIEVFERRLEGIYLSKEEIAGIKGERKYNGQLDFFGFNGDVSARSGDAGTDQSPVIAVINISGIIAQHASQVDNVSGPGGTSTERIAHSIDAAMSEPRVKGIVFNIDSPGGSVAGVQQVAEKIFSYRGQKPMVAQCNSLMASAAYWIGAAADEIVVAQGGQVGSIGVYSTHVDASKKAESEGLKFTLISAGKFKVDGNPYEPLSDTALAHSQKQVNSYYSDFIGAVAKYRGVTSEDVRNGFGQGRVEKDTAAVAAKLADRVDSLEGTISRMGDKARPSRRMAKAVAGKPMIKSQVSSLVFKATDDGAALVGDWEKTIAVTPDAIDAGADNIGITDAGIEFNVTNASAKYTLAGFDLVSGSLIFELAEGNVDVRIQSEEEKRAAEIESDAHRRRRFAAKVRSLI